ncbi:hypothetical protein K0M31_016425 [Melipona bicolor]|uniref:Uncharacterized protein n=1 Tax=Melipona bicolor TaxID=60889 RepID=A0AA40KTI3_9HYME|nr:hypothetical protein K0M31_016425 [Melipona bicolor]
MDTAAEKEEKTWMRITDEVSLPSDEKSKEEHETGEKRKPERGARILVTDVLREKPRVVRPNKGDIQFLVT